MPDQKMEGAGPFVERWDSAEDGPLNGANLRRKLEGRGYSVTRYIYEPGTIFPGHVHKNDKVDAVLSGKFRMTFASHEVVLEAGDLIFLPGGTEHSAAVVGREPVINFDGVLD